jgi:hypothetical protein
MIRDINDPRVALVMRAIDRAIASPDNSLPSLVAGALLDYPWSIAGDSRFTYDGSEWTPGQMRAVVLAYACVCPEVEIDELAEEAREKLEWCEWWDREGRTEAGAA